jgi:DNA modification methylase
MPMPLFPPPPRLNTPLATEYASITDLKEMPDIPRRHPESQIRAVAKSLHAFGQVLPILVDSEGRIISGQALKDAAERIGMTQVMIIRANHLDAMQVKALRVALNRLGDLSDFDDAALNPILLELYEADLTFDLEATGFVMPEIELRILDLDFAGAEAAEDTILVGDGPTVTQPGDLFHLGVHRLFCGSALEASSWATLMGDDLAALVVTDSPWNVPINGHVSGLGKHKHREFAMAVGEMSEQEFTDFLQTSMHHAYSYSKPGSVHYWAIDWRHVGEIITAGKSVYERYLNMAVWAKNQPGMGSFLRSQHELFFIFAKGGAPTRNNIQLGRFGRSRSNLWSYGSAASMARTSEEGNPLAAHPTVKPLALVCDILLDASVKGDIIVDCFAGSGVCLIAAEKLGRVARCIELDAAYCDAIIRRWQHWTGEAAIRAADGALFSAVEAMVIDASDPTPEGGAV